MVIERRRKPPSALSFLIEVLWRCFTISKKEMPINEEIREKEIRVIGPDGAALGIMSSKEALQIAQRENLDLVNISPKAVPPVCKIMNYGKYRFEQAKREKEQPVPRLHLRPRQNRIRPDHRARWYRPWACGT